MKRDTSLAWLTAVTIALLMAVMPALARDNVYFDPVPMDNTISLGQSFNLTFQAHSRDNSTVYYSLVHAEQGMTIDSNTGVFSWTPTDAGQYVFGVKAYTDNDPENQAIQQVYLMVHDTAGKPQLCADVTGTVKDSTGNGIPNAVVQAFLLGNNGSIHNFFYAYTKNDGTYNVKVPKGTFKLYVYAEGYLDQWYDNATNPNDAQNVTIACGQSSSVDFTLRHEGGPIRNNIFIYSYPPQAPVAPGGTFTYDVNATSGNIAVIHYELIQSPADMTIDSLTGVISWVTTTAGKYEVTVRAYDAAHPADFDEQRFEVVVQTNGKGSICAVITGVLQDTTGTPIPQGVVEAVPVAFDPMHPGDMHDGQFMAVTDANGRFDIGVPAGNYALVARGNFMSGFYNNSNIRDSITIITVQCQDSTDVVFNVYPFHKPNYHSVSGQVTAQNGGAPVPSIVQFSSVNNTNDSTNWNRNTMKVHTDQNGNYTIMLPDNFSYKAVAIPIHHNYQPEYYDNVLTFQDATVIQPTSDLTGINFSLPDLPNFNNGLNGTVTDSTGTGVPAMVSIISVNPNKDPLSWWGTTVMTDSTDPGKFAITNIAPGNYILLGIPMDMHLVPGFYVENDFATLNWNNATQIHVSQDSTPSYTYNIELKAGRWFHGIFRLKGFIGRHHGLTKQTGPIPQGSDVVPGALVAVLDGSNDVVGYTISGTDGSFDLSNLDAGNYTLLVSKPGFEAYTANIKLDQTSGTISTQAITLTPATTLGVQDPAISANGFDLYPNPAIDKLQLNIPDMTGPADITVFGTNGGALLQSSSNLDGSSVQLNVSSLPAGSYLIRISSATQGTMIGKFIISR